MISRQRGRRLRPGVEPLDDRCLPSGFTPSQIAAAYGLGPITLTSPSGQAVAGDGSGQTIAIIGAFHNPNLPADLGVFSRTFGLPDPKLTVVNLAGSQTNAAWASESALDAEWAHALAPGASILMVEAKSDTQTDLMDAVNIARNTPGVVAVSMSWGLPESASQKSLDHLFTTPAGHTGITFVAASGDGGAGKGAVYPASSPNVLGVGGTTLTLDALGGYQSEAIWADSGTGVSRITAEPSYQRSLQKTGGKSVPDVSFLSDPETGVQVYSTPPGATTGSWQVVAGTSLGTPAWAAIVAIVAQGRALDGKPGLDGSSQTLPLLYGLPSSSFNQVASGRVGSLAAGLGTPRGDAVIRGLISIASVSTDLTSTTQTPQTQTQTTPIAPPRPVLAAKGPKKVVIVRRKAASQPRPHLAAARWNRLIAQTTARKAAAAASR
ncbi:MAG: S53 family peptidase [Paludisphaera borealis]|uniref:S53 family peptidase n=1 Tax=Paludisphaera borealis TaxID=1387353 RepID=UPI0028502039|nr:S53 family peptidase [Paludisphaera borealis]MDR3619187.1 S53 family peptidase [Paludisphaera borealis]